MFSRLTNQIGRAMKPYDINTNEAKPRSYSANVTKRPSVSVYGRRGVHKKCSSREKSAKKKQRKRPEEKLSVWEQIFGPSKKKKVYPKECCRYLASKRPDPEEIPGYVLDMQEPGNTITRSGRGYIVEIPHIIGKPRRKTREQQLIDKMTDLKEKRYYEDVCNPMPSFTTVGQRLIDLQERKLHPLYKRYELMPRLPKKWTVAAPDCSTKPVYSDIPPSKAKQTVKPEVIVPRHKDLYWDYKMTELPQQMAKKLSEVRTEPCDLDIAKTDHHKKLCKQKGGPKHFKKCPPGFCY